MGNLVIPDDRAFGWSRKATSTGFWSLRVYRLLDGNATTEAAAAHRQMPPVQKPKSKSAQRVGSDILRPQVPAARGRAQSRFRPTLTPINMLDTERVRNAIRAEILAILRDMGPRPPRGSLSMPQKNSTAAPTVALRSEKAIRRPRWLVT